MTRRRRAGRTEPITLTTADARRRLVSHLGLARFERRRGAAGVRAVLARLGCIQVDPLDRFGTNVDLVVHARTVSTAHGDAARHLFPDHAFEHFAKERCVLPAAAFPYYRDRAVETPWWRLGDRLTRLPKGVVERVRDEIHARGPIAASALTDHGAVTPMDWQGWKGTSRATSMAIEVLFTRCEVVVAGRDGREKLWASPERALGARARTAPERPFAEWAITARAHSAGLLSTNAGPWWSMLSDERTGRVPDALVERGELVRVSVEGSPRNYLATPAFLEARPAAPDDHLRVLGPLDPLVWDRKLTAHAFGFDYIWEVYKPAPERRWGYYVAPLLHRGALVGRMEAHVEDRTLVVDSIFPEAPRSIDPGALGSSLERLTAAADCKNLRAPARAWRNPRRPKTRASD